MKQGKSCSPDSDKKEAGLTHDTEKLRAYIVLGTDEDGDDFVAVQFADGCQEDMAGLMFLLMSGGIMEECVKSLRRACEDENEAQMILHMLASAVKQHAAQHMKARTRGPVVDPTEVFSKRERDDYKG